MKRFIHRRLNSFHFAWNGMILFFKFEVHARVHLIMAIAVLFLGWFFAVSAWEWVALMFSIGLVVQAEIWNTVFEKLADFIQPNFDPKVKVIKDLAASAVLWCSFCAAVVGAIVFLPYILGWWGG